MFTPEDISKKTFTSSMLGGYNKDEVNKALAEIRKEYEYLYNDYLELKETVERVSSKLEYYQQMESTMQSSLQVAQEAAEEVKAASEKKAALLEQETQAKCEQLLAEAKDAAKKLHDEAMATAEEMYNKTKINTENLLHAAETEANNMRTDARMYADNLRKTTDLETEKQRLSIEDLCKKRVASATNEANGLLEKTRAEASKLALEATQKYNDMLSEAKENTRKLVADTEDKCNKMVYEAESRATIANTAYESAIKKSAVHRKQMLNLLKTQMEMVQDFEDPSNS